MKKFRNMGEQGHIIVPIEWRRALDLGQIVELEKKEDCIIIRNPKLEGEKQK